MGILVGAAGLVKSVKFPFVALIVGGIWQVSAPAVVIEANPVLKGSLKGL
jgi:hypothetical protein